MYLAESTNVEDVTPLLEAELDRLDELRADGVLVDGWVKADYSGAVLLLSCADDDSMLAALDSLPTAIAGATTFVTKAVVDLASVRP